MRLSVGALSLVAFSRLGAAQSQCFGLTSLFPACAFSCVSSAASQVGCTNAQDLGCQCTPASSSAILVTAQPCVLSCGVSEIPPAISAGRSICECVASAATTTTEQSSVTTSQPSATTSQPPVTTSQSTSQSPVTTSQQSTTQPPSSQTTGPITSSPDPSCDTTSPCQQSADAVPNCAKSCIDSAAVSAASCATTDYQCQCASSSIIQGAALGCVTWGCGIQTGLQVLQSVSALCSCVSANPTTPCSSQASSTASSKPATTQTSSPAETSTPGGTTAAPSCSAPTQADCGPIASSAVPSCAQACFSSYVPQIGCKITDYSCQCQPKAQQSLSQLLVPCVATACPPASIPAVITGASSVCQCATAPPSGGDCTTTNGSGGQTETQTKIATETVSCETETPITSAPASTCEPSNTVDCGPVASSAVPSCAQKCFSSAVPLVSCSIDDYACQCEGKAQSSLSKLLIPCVATACPPAAIPSVIAGASSVCQCASSLGGDNCATKTGGESPPVPKPTSEGNCGGVCPSGSQPPGNGGGNPTVPGGHSGGPQPSSSQQPENGGNCGGACPSGSQPPGNGGGKPTAPGDHSGGPQPSSSQQPGNGGNCGGACPPESQKPGNGGGNPSAPGGHSGGPQPPPSQQPGNGGNCGGSCPSGSQPGNGGKPTGNPTAPPVVQPGSAGRYEMGLVGCVLSALLAVVVAL